MLLAIPRTLPPLRCAGLIGQAYDRDDKKVVGALDNYFEKDNSVKVVVTQAMGEGAIEGTGGAASHTACTLLI